MRGLTKKELDSISTSEADRIDEVITGSTVVANMRKGADTVLIKWAKRNGVFVRIDRKTAYGNRFELKHYRKAESIELYRQEMMELEFIVVGGCCGGEPKAVWAAINSGLFAGKVLGCWCFPLACHGDVIVGLVNDRYGDPVPVTRKPRQLILFA